MSRTFKRYLILSAALMLPSAGYALIQQPSADARAVRPTSVVGDLIDMASANDGRLDTRATSGRANYIGLSVILDLGGENNVIGVIQEHGRWPTSYPQGYRVEVGSSASGPWRSAFEGPGARGESRALFDARRGRFVRLTATSRGPEDWAIAEVRVVVDPRARPDLPDPSRRRPYTPPSAGSLTGDLRDLNRALDRNLETRATSGTPRYANMSILYDLGGEYEISRVVQIHGQWSEEYAQRYKVEVSRQRDESRFREVWRGAGTSGRSVATFDKVATRYIRITALDASNRFRSWSIAELRTDLDEDIVDGDDDGGRVDRPLVRADARGLRNANLAIDDTTDTRATSFRSSYSGSWILLDMGGSYTISRVIQVHSPHQSDFPRRYRVEVSDDSRRWTTVWEGEGIEGRSRALFDPVRARYVRITATAERGGRYSWSISRVRISG